MEGKNSVTKRAAQTSNFKKITYTVVKRHQRLLCAYLQGQNVFDKTLECGPGMYYTPHWPYCHKNMWKGSLALF